MKNNLLHSIRIGITLVAFLAFSVLAHATLYTATTSGSWSNPTTWGGSAPGYVITGDQIEIPAGLIVTLDNDLQLNGALVTLNVIGTLKTNTNVSLTATLGNILGNGSMEMDKMHMAAGSTFTFTGNLSVKEMNTYMTNMPMTASMTVGQTLTLSSGALNINGGGSLNIGPGADIVISGGKMLLNGGTANMTQDYNVKYLSATPLTGMELTGTGLNNVLINVPAGTDVKLANDLIVKGSFNTLSGNLDLNGKDLTLKGAIAAGGSGYVKSTPASDIYLLSTAGTTGKLAFEGTGNAVKDMTVNVGSANSATISGELTVMNKLDLNSGTLDFANTKLALNGDVVGTGSLKGDNNSVLSINKNGGLATAMNFDPNSSVKDLNINVGQGNSVTLGTAVSVYGNLYLQDKSELKLAAQTLTFEGLGSMTGNGALVVTDKSGLVINSTNGMSSPLALKGNTIGTLAVNTETGKYVTLNNDLAVATMLSLQNGTLDLNGKNLLIKGDIASGGTGTLSSTSASNITVNSTASSTGALNFDGYDNAVNNFTVNMSNNKQTNITGNLTVQGDLDLTNGILGFNHSTLILDNKIKGNGQLYGGSDANLVMKGNGPMNFATGGQSLKSLSFGINANDTIYLNSNMTIEDTLHLSLGNVLWIGNHVLTIGHNGTIVGLGSLYGDSTSTLAVNADNGIESEIYYTGATLGNLTLNSANSGTLKMGNDMVISKNLNLQKGDLDLNTYDLTITGNMTPGSVGTITSTDESDITIKTITAPTGALSFSSWGNTVGNLNVNIANYGALDVYTDLEIAEALNFIKGKLDIGNYELEMDSSSLILGASLTSYIIADTAGYLSMHISKGNTNSVLFPIGTSSSYAPIMLTLTGNSNSGRIEANVIPNVWEDGNSGKDLSLTQPLVDLTWGLQADTVIKNMHLNAQVMWLSGAEVNGFDRTKAYISTYNGTKWTTSPADTASTQPGSMYSFTMQNMTSLSPLAVFGKDAITEVHDFVNSSKFTVYPNPAVATVYINNSTVSNDPIKADIINVNGQVLKTQVIDNSIEAINLDELNPGNYYIRISGKDTNEIKHFIKQ